MTKEIRVINGIPLTQNERGFWADCYGTEYAFQDAVSVDDKVRIGVGAFSLPESDPLTDAARRHDYCFSSQVCQHYHKRINEDLELLRQAAIVNGAGWWSRVKLWAIKRIIGTGISASYWEDPETRW